MKDYSRIIGKITSTPWMITPDALRFMLELFDAHIEGRITQEEIQARLAASDKKGNGGRSTRSGRIGVLSLTGPIFPRANMMTELSGATDMSAFREEFRSMMGDESVAAILIDIDSPGGMADQIEEMATEIREARKTKPVYAIANTAMNSAAYYIGAQATKVYATPSGQLGSIGTYTVHLDDSGLQEKVGVKKTVIKAGRFKAIGEEPLNPEAKQQLQNYIDAVNDSFVHNVALGRGLTDDYVRENFGEGATVTPQFALEHKMIDGIKTIDEVVSTINVETGGSLAVAAFAGAIQSGAVMFDYDNGTITYSDSTTLNLVDMTTTNAANTRQSYDADKEHSEPGTGQGGEPVPREPPETGDKAIEGGWRRDPPPIAYEEVEEFTVNRAWLEERATALGVEFNAEMSDDDLASAVAEKVDEVVVPLNQATAKAQADQEFAEKYPEQAARLAKLEQKDRETEANQFAEKFAQLEGGRAVAPVVREQIENVHLLLSERRMTHEELDSLITALTSDKSVVPMTEAGSARSKDEEVVRPGATVQEVRKQFAELVSAAMTEDKLDRKAAIEHVAEQHPDLALAYKNSSVRS